MTMRLRLTLSGLGILAGVALLTASGARADAVLVAPIGHGTAGASSVVPGSLGGGGGAGGTQSTVYFETGNLSRGLPWNALPKSRWASWHRQAAANGGLPARLADGRNARSIERQLLAAACPNGATTSGRCFLWTNECPEGESVVHRRPFNGRVDRGQVGCRVPDWRRNAQELHTRDSWGGVAVMDELSQWQVQVFREGESRPVFERRVAIGRDGRLLADADAAGGSSSAWWTSGGSLAGVGNRAFAGPLGAWRDASDPSYLGCRSRYRSAPHIITGSFPVDGKPARIAYTNGALTATSAPKVGGDTYSCYWGGWSNGGRGWLPGSGSRAKAPCAGCFYEGLHLSWQVPRSEWYAGGGVVKARFSYRLLGRPNTFYAIRIVSLDHREQLLMPNAFQAGRHVYFSQYLHVLMPTGIQGFDFDTPECPCTPGDAVPKTR